MRENKCCGNCAHSYAKDMDGYCACGVDNHYTSCDEVCDNHILSINGWIEITPDNVKELYKTLDRVIIAHIIPDTIIKDVVAYEKPNELYRSLEIIAAIGGYYYYVLPELKIE